MRQLAYSEREVIIWPRNLTYRVEKGMTVYCQCIVGSTLLVATIELVDVNLRCFAEIVDFRCREIARGNFTLFGNAAGEVMSV